MITTNRHLDIDYAVKFQLTYATNRYKGLWSRLVSVPPSFDRRYNQKPKVNLFYLSSLRQNVPVYENVVVFSIQLIKVIATSIRST